jgi:hypothetical protein
MPHALEGLNGLSLALTHQALGNRPPVAVWREGIGGVFHDRAVGMWATRQRCPHAHSRNSNSNSNSAGRSVIS